MQQIYRETSMQKCDFSKLQTSSIEILLPRVCYRVNLLHTPRKAILKNTYGELLLQILIKDTCHIFQYKFVSNLACFLMYFWLIQMFFSERAVLRLPEFSFFLLRLVPCQQHFVTFCWIVVLLQIVSNNLGLCGLQTYFKKIIFNVVRLFKCIIAMK